MFGTSAAPRPTAPRAPGSGRLGITFHDSVTNAAGPGNDLLMMVSDEELLVASVGDEEAFAAFYRRYARPLAGFFMRRTGDAELAADLTAETFAAALATRRRFDPAKGPAIGWLYGIARHKLARTLEHCRVEDRARRKLGMAPLALDDEAIELVVTADGEVVQLVQRLPADQRAAIEARVVDGQEYEQIAAAMTDFFDELERALRRAHRRDTERHARSRLFDRRRLPGLPAAGLRTLVALAVVLALVAVVLVVARESDVKRPAAAPGKQVVTDVPSGDDADRQSRSAGRPPSEPGIARRAVTEKGVTFSFRVPRDWERFSSIPTDKSAGGPISLNKSFGGPQQAEAIIFWTSFPDGDYADPCARLLSPPVGSSAANLAAAVSTAPGTELVTGPSNVTLGGRPAKLVELTVHENVGCDPGFFYTWKEVPGGAFWRTTGVGDTISVWIVDIDGTRLFIEAQTKQTAAGAETLYDRQAVGDLKQEVEQIVESIRFE